MDKVQKHNSFNTNTSSSESYKNDLVEGFGVGRHHWQIAWKLCCLPNIELVFVSTYWSNSFLLISLSILS
jgi:hypothetical protein